MKNTILFLLASSLCLVQTSFAKDKKDSPCKHLQGNITLTNNAYSLCRVDAVLNHGTWVFRPAQIITPYQGTHFDIVEGFFGPDVTITVTCDSVSTSFETQQNLSFINAGNISTQILSSSGLIAQVENSQRGYCSSLPWMHENPGQVMWAIH